MNLNKTNYLSIISYSHNLHITLLQSIPYPLAWQEMSMSSENEEVFRVTVPSARRSKNEA